MSKLPVTLILAFSLSIGWSQSPFTSLDTKWTFEGWSEGSGWLPNWEGECEGNQIINEVTDQIIIDGKTCGIITTSKNENSLILYQEEDIVYFYEDSTFYKLYDYGAVIGDTVISFRPKNAQSFALTTYNIPPEPYLLTDTIYTLITDLDTSIINGVELRIWETQPLNYADDLFSDYKSIIENVGSMNGLAGFSNFFVATGCEGGLVCYASEDLNLVSGFFMQCDFPSSINDFDETSINIYPNPSSGIFLVETDEMDIMKIEVFTLNGISLLSTKEKTIDLSNYQAGIYFISIVDSDNNQIMKRLVKQ